MCLGVMASPLTPEQALRRVTETKAVKKFMKGNAESPRLVMSGMTSKGSAAYYIFTEKTGTLFVAADDVVNPLLGYSDSGDFDPNNMPPQLKWWLKMYADEIEYATREKGKRVPTLNPKKTTVVAESKTAIAPMLKTQWDQTKPYNDYCPKYQGELTVTGCVATSTAQVMNYFEWPQTTVNSISYKWNNTTLTSPAVKFQWDQMLDSYDGNYTTNQADAVARLMQVVGYAVNMNYDISSNGGSGAYSSNIRTALVEKFGYDVGANYLYRDFFTAEEWDNMIYDNLRNVGPIIYSGDGSEGGHSFVCDGYDGYGAYHINWGWGGLDDGYFMLSALNPEVLGTGGGAGGFNYNQDAVLGIRKPVAGSTVPNPILGCTASISGSVYWNYLMIGATNDGGYYNFGTESATFTYGVELKNVETGVTTFLSDADDDYLEPLYGCTLYYIEVPESFADGTYTVRPVYKVNSSDWQYVRFYEGNTDSFMISLSAGNITILDNNEGEVYISSWKCPTELVAGEAYSISLNIRNTYNSSVGYSLDAYLCSEDGDYLNIEEELGSHYVNIPAQGTATMTFSGTLNKNLKPGEYYIVLAQDGEVVDYVTVNVVSSSDSNIIYSGLGASCDWTFENIVMPSELSYIWKWDGQYLKGSGYVKKAYAAEGWAISPEIDLTGVSEANVNFAHAGKFQTTMKELCGFYVREIGGEWTKLNIANWPKAGTWDFVEAGEMSLNDFAGKKIQLGAKYGSTLDGADTWEIKNVEVRGSGEPVVNPDPVDPTPAEDVTLDIIDAENITGEFHETSYNSNNGIQAYAHYQPLDGLDIKGYEFYFDKENDKATDPSLYMDINGVIPQTLRLYKSNIMLVDFPAGAEVSTFTWNFKSVKGLDYVNVDSGEAQVYIKEKKLVWTNTDGVSSVMFTIPDEKGSDGQNPNLQITSFDVITGNGEIDPDPIVPTPDQYLYIGLVDDCDWTFENIVMPDELAYIWKWDGQYLKGSGYVKKAYAAEAWAISPVIDLTKAADPSVNFDHAGKFQTTMQELCGFYVREVGGEWTKLYIANWPEEGTWNFVEAGEMSLRDFTGKKIQLGAKYGSSLAGADTWELKNVIVKDALTGVADVVSDYTEPIYFDLMGRRVVKPVNGIYIMVDKDKTSKILVK